MSKSKFKGYVSEDNTNDFFDGLDFKTKTHSASISDCSINKIAKGFSITFRNGLPDTIGSHISIAIKENTIFFKPDPKGWAITHSNRVNGYTQVRNEIFDLTDFIGDYNIQYFEPLNIWYIQKEDKYEQNNTNK